MLGKLLKYDLKWTIKIIYIFLGLGFIFAVSGRVLDLLFDSFFFELLDLYLYQFLFLKHLQQNFKNL